MNQNQIQTSILANTLWVTLEKWGGQMINLLVFIMLARFLGPDQFGLVAMANIFSALVTVFLDQGFSEAIIQAKEISKSYLSTAFWLNLGIGIILSIIGFFSSGLIAIFFDEPRIIPIIKAFSLSFAITSFGSVQVALMKRQMQFQTLSIIILIGRFLSGVVALYIGWTYASAWAIVLQSIILTSTTSLLSWFAGSWRPSFLFSKLESKELFKFGVNILGLKLITFFSTRFDDLIIGYMLGSVALGIYTTAYRILRILNDLLLQVASSIALPVFSGLQDDPSQLQRSILDATHYVGLIALPICGVVFVATEQIVIFLWGDIWIETVPIMRLLVFLAVTGVFTTIPGNALVAIGKPNVWFSIRLIVVTIRMVTMLAVANLGLIWITGANVISAFVISIPLAFLMTNQYLKIATSNLLKEYWLPLILTVFLTIAFLIYESILNWIYPKPPTWSIFILITLTAVTYMLMVLSAKPELRGKMRSFVASK
jgi:teichuronic acid exporter